MPLHAETRKSNDGCERVSGQLTRCFKAYAEDPETDARCFDYLENMRKCCSDYGAISGVCKGWLAERRKIEKPPLTTDSVIRSTVVDKYADRMTFSPAEYLSDTPI